VSECDREASTMRRPWPTRVVAPGGGDIVMCSGASEMKLAETIFKASSENYGNT
jgi:hypothetical protein